MIAQHLLQQQRLNYNHDRLLQRYQRINTPQISEFRTFGTSSLPGRNYEQYLNTMNSNSDRRDSLVAQSRAGIGSSNETYRLMGDGTSETLPRSITSVMQHSRQQPASVVHAEKFEPIKFYEHPVFGPTPAYLRPVFNNRQHQEEINDTDSDKDDSDTEDNEVRSHTSGNTSTKADHKEETKSLSTAAKDNDEDEDEDEDSDHAPKGYISYKKWKAKYKHVIPVNPLLYNIYTQRPNGSIHSYGQSVYASSNRLRQLTRDEDVSTPTLSDIGSVTSETPREPSLSSNRRYHRLQPRLVPKTVTPRPLEPIRAESEGDASDDEASPPDSPVPYLSRNRPNPVTSTSLSTTLPPAPAVPTIGTTSFVPTTGITPVVPITGITPVISTAGITSSPISTVVTPSTFNTPIINTSGTSSLPFTSTNTSNIPPAPPMPSSLLTTSSNPTYQARSNIPIAPSMPTSFSTAGSTGAYQTPSSISLPPPSAPSLSGSTTKAVTFGGSSAISMPENDVSSSSDSDDDEKQKRRRRRKRQAAAGVDVESSSDD